MTQCARTDRVLHGCGFDPVPVRREIKRKLSIEVFSKKLLVVRPDHVSIKHLWVVFNRNVELLAEKREIESCKLDDVYRLFGASVDYD